MLVNSLSVWALASQLFCVSFWKSVAAPTFSVRRFGQRVHSSARLVWDVTVSWNLPGSASVRLRLLWPQIKGQRTYLFHQLPTLMCELGDQPQLRGNWVTSTVVDRSPLFCMQIMCSCMWGACEASRTCLYNTCTQKVYLHISLHSNCMHNSKLCGNAHTSGVLLSSSAQLFLSQHRYAQVEMKEKSLKCTQSWFPLMTTAHVDITVESCSSTLFLFNNIYAKLKQ